MKFLLLLQQNYFTPNDQSYKTHISSFKVLHSKTKSKTQRFEYFLTSQLSNINDGILKINYVINCVSFVTPCGRGANYYHNITLALVPS